jgi:hypothetical protein
MKLLYTDLKRNTEIMEQSTLNFIYFLAVIGAHRFRCFYSQVTLGARQNDITQ